MKKFFHKVAALFNCQLFSYYPLIILFPGYLVAAPGNTAFQPFAMREQNLFNLIHGQALPVNAALIGQSEALWSNSLIITNTLNIETTGNEDIYLDYEAWRYTFSYQYGLNRNWNIKVDVPVIYQSGGVFDSAIDDWHQLFGLPRGERPSVANNQYDIRYSYQSQQLIGLNEANMTAGDMQLAVARSVIDSSNMVMSVWAGIKLPTGDKASLTGSGATDFSTWLALNRQLAENWVLNMNAGAVVPGVGDYNNMPLSDYVLYGHVMLGWLVNDVVSLKLQLQGHGSYYEHSDLKILGNSYFLVFGGTITFSECNQLDIGFSEDIDVGASPDASLLLNWRHYSSPSCQ